MCPHIRGLDSNCMFMWVIKWIRGSEDNFVIRPFVSRVV